MEFHQDKIYEAYWRHDDSILYITVNTKASFNILPQIETIWNIENGN